MLGALLRILSRVLQLFSRPHRPNVTRPGPASPPAGTATEANSLNDLLRIRAANRERIEAVNGNLGTALGFKWTDGRRTDHPCVIIFVPQKVDSRLVPEAERAPGRLESPDGIWCLTDIVTGGSAASVDDFDPLPPLSQANKDVVKELRSGRIGLIGGIQLAHYKGGIENREHGTVGTAGIAVRHPETGETGFVTNQHVADAPGRVIYHPWPRYFPIGATVETKLMAADEGWYDGVIDEANSYVRCDFAFVQVNGDLVGEVKAGVHAVGKTGDLLRIDPGTMDAIGQKVVGVGRTRGVQRGTVVAYSYEWNDGAESVYTDLLIIGEEGMAFSDKGDSGKIIVTDDEQRRPVALLWGGWQERLRHGREQENWTYAIDLGKVLDRLHLELLTEGD